MDAVREFLAERHAGVAELALWVRDAVLARYVNAAVAERLFRP
jgi:hypothetical protein